MSILKTIDDALDDVLVAEVTRPESVAEQVNRTGLHPVTAGGRGRRHAHALPWCAGHVYLDAKDALDGVQVTGRHVDRSILPRMSLLAHEVECAVWTLGAVTR